MPENKIDNPIINDNRNYDYTQFPTEERHEYEVIAGFIPSGAKVIDLGCGNGSLLQKLIKEKNISGVGVETSKSGIDVCNKKGLTVIDARIDQPLNFTDNSFDYSICNVTIQMVMYPEVLLKEMKRISGHQIISFPNFGFYKNRIDLLLNGRMPRPMLFNYNWYLTGHIHQLSMKDFFELVDNVGGLKVKHLFLESSTNPVKNYLMKKYPNAFQVLPIFLLERI